jgi:hypothetical protein
VREQFLNFIFKNDRSSILLIVGHYLLTLFTVLYNFWFSLLIKISTWFTIETHLVKTVVAFTSFFITIYILLYILKKIIMVPGRLIWFITIKILNMTFGSLLKRINEVSSDNIGSGNVKK